MVTPAAFSSISCTAYYLPGSLGLDGLYYSVADNMEPTARAELGPILHKLVSNLGYGFYITYSKLKEVFGSTGDINKFIFILLQETYQDENNNFIPKFKLASDIDGDDLALYVNSDITEILASFGYPTIKPLVDGISTGVTQIVVQIVPVSPPLRTIVELSLTTDFAEIVDRMDSEETTEFVFQGLDPVTPYNIRLKYVVPEYETEWGYEYAVTESEGQEA